MEVCLILFIFQNTSVQAGHIFSFGRELIFDIFTLSLQIDMRITVFDFNFTDLKANSLTKTNKLVLTSSKKRYQEMLLLGLRLVENTLI